MVAVAMHCLCGKKCTAVAASSVTSFHFRYSSYHSNVLAVSSRGGSDIVQSMRKGRPQKWMCFTSDTREGKEWRCDVPLVFVPGMKGSHLSSSLEDDSRAWISLSGLLNFPPHKQQSLALPLSYTDGVQDRGHLREDGVVDYIVERFGLFPFYGHVTRQLHQAHQRYHHQSNNTHLSTTTTKHIQKLDDDGHSSLRSHDRIHSRPTAVFAYDWRRSLSELSEQLHHFCSVHFPNRVVQFVAHSLGGLLAYRCMQRYPDHYAPGAVLVGVPFGTGVQYLQDLHRGYFTELGRCQQFLPITQFTFSSHWSFFPPIHEQQHSFVDVTDLNIPIFEADKSSIGNNNNNKTRNKREEPFNLNGVRGGNPISMDFYDPDEWERNELGIFDPKHRLDEDTLSKYKSHLRIQMNAALEWRRSVMNDDGSGAMMPPLVICATDTIPTVNQILRRRRRQRPWNGTVSSSTAWEYDYCSGRSVPGDGRIDYEKAFPTTNVSYQRVALNSIHAKQMCNEKQGGNWNTIWRLVMKQMECYDGSTTIDIG